MIDSTLISASYDSVSRAAYATDTIPALRFSTDSLPIANLKSNSIQSTMDSLPSVMNLLRHPVDLLDFANDTVKHQLINNFAGIPKVTSFFHSDIVISSFIVIFLALCIILFLDRRSKIRYIGNIFSSKNTSASIRITAKEQIRVIFFGIVAVIGYGGLLFFVLTKGDTEYITNPWQMLSLIGIGFTGVFLIKYIILKLYIFAFFSERESTGIRQYFSIIFALGAIAFLTLVGLVFSSEAIHPFLYKGFLILMIISLLLTFYALLKTFFNQINLLLYFILYLCTLEILPLLMFFKALAGQLNFIT